MVNLAVEIRIAIDETVWQLAECSLKAVIGGELDSP